MNPGNAFDTGASSGCGVLGDEVVSCQSSKRRVARTSGVEHRRAITPSRWHFEGGKVTYAASPSATRDEALEAAGLAE